MDKRKMKKLLILNLPYFLVGLFATNLGEAWRLAEGADSSAKILSFFNALPIALNNPLPSFHPLDLLIGIASKGTKYRSHAATIYKWAQEDEARKPPKKGIPDYTFKEGESL